MHQKKKHKVDAVCITAFLSTIKLATTPCARDKVHNVDTMSVTVCVTAPEINTHGTRCA